MPIILDETKLDAEKFEGIEFCPRRQGQPYQLHGTSLWSVCYLDPPAIYFGLNSLFPPVHMVTIGDILAGDGAIDILLQAHRL